MLEVSSARAEEAEELLTQLFLVFFKKKKGKKQNLIQILPMPVYLCVLNFCYAF